MVLLKNRTFTHALDGQTPYKVIHHLKPNLSRLPEWGTCIWVHNATGSKLDVRAMTCHWIGYDTESKASRVYWPQQRKVSVECNICFEPDFIAIRSTEFKKQSYYEPAPTSDHLSDMAPSADGTPSHENIISSHPKQLQKPSTYVQWICAGEGTTTGHSSTPILPCRFQDPTNEPIEHVDDTGPISEYATLAVTGSGPGMEPRNKHEAKASPDWPKWKVAMSEEMTQLHANKT